MVVNDRLRLTRNISLPKGGREISIKVDKDWGPGSLSDGHRLPARSRQTVEKLPVRAMNLHWFSIDKDQRKCERSRSTPQTP